MFGLSDPVRAFVARLLRRFSEAEDLKPDERQFVADNITKHTKVLRYVLASMVLTIVGLLNTPAESLTTIVMALIGPVGVFGGGWFAITLGAVPKQLSEEGMELTFYMLTAFLMSLSAMFISVSFITHVAFWPVFAFVFYAGTACCIKYDTADGLKLGLEAAQHAHARYAIGDYKARQIEPTDE